MIPRQSRSSAFTLIELLVVIAIIAILAAILFPVFAQAKAAAKKAAGISQAKQTGTGMLLYTGDTDDMAPTGTVPDLPTEGAYKAGTFSIVNPGDYFTSPTAYLNDSHMLVWNNAIQPYTKNYDIMNLPGMKDVAVTIPGDTPASRKKQPKGCNLTYNGHLQNYSLSAVAAPSTNPMVWQGIGNITRTGLAQTNPRLNCLKVGPCVYNAGGPPQSAMAPTDRGDVFVILLGGETSYYTYGQGNLFIATDSSARLVKPGNGNQGQGNARLNTVWPIQFVETDGTVKNSNNFIRGRYNGSSLYTAGFLPDNTYAN